MATLNKLVSFNGLNGTYPYAGLIADANGDLFGTASEGGFNGGGTVFEIQNTGTVAAPIYASAPSVLINFNGSNGSYPTSLIADANGDLFGITNLGGANNEGTAFEIKNTGTAVAPVYATTPTTLVNFGGSNAPLSTSLIADAKLAVRYEGRRRHPHDDVRIALAGSADGAEPVDILRIEANMAITWARDLSSAPTLDGKVAAVAA